MSLKIKAGKIVAENGLLKNGQVTVSDGIISAVESEPSGTADLDFSDFTLVPGFIDIHTHGYYGIDSFSSEESDILEWAGRIPETGVTAFVPAFVSLPLEDIFSQFSRYRNIINNQVEGARILGVRCEGPYLSPEKRGAHNSEYLRVPELDEMMNFFRKGSGVLKIIDIAPELGEIAPVIELAREHGTIVSTGHSNADYATAVNAFASGSPLVTHFYNAMSGMTHREVGLVGAGLLHEGPVLELIADLHHVSVEAIEILNRMRGFHNAALVTDSLAVGGATDASLTLGGLPVTLHDGVAWIGDTDTIAGSVLTMDMAVRNILSIGYQLEDFIGSTSTVQSRLLGLKDRGYIGNGYRADLCAIDEGGKVVATIIGGKIAYRNF